MLSKPLISWWIVGAERRLKWWDLVLRSWYFCRWTFCLFSIQRNDSIFTAKHERVMIWYWQLTIRSSKCPFLFCGPSLIHRARIWFPQVCTSVYLKGKGFVSPYRYPHHIFRRVLPCSSRLWRTIRLWRANHAPWSCQWCCFHPCSERQYQWNLLRQAAEKCCASWTWGLQRRSKRRQPINWKTSGLWMDFSNYWCVLVVITKKGNNDKTVLSNLLKTWSPHVCISKYGQQIPRLSLV